MPDTPETQAHIATRIGELEAVIARQLAGIQEWERTVNRLSNEKWTARMVEIHTARLVLDQQREEANALRARIGLPLVIANEEQPATVAPPTSTNWGGCLGVFALIGIVATVVVLWGVASRVPRTRTYVPAQPVTRSVFYFIGGTARQASLTYENESGGVEQRTVNVPWQMHFDAKPGTFLSISAQNEGDWGTITCAIIAGADTIQRASSDGGFSIASCSGDMP